VTRTTLQLRGSQWRRPSIVWTWYDVISQPVVMSTSNFCECFNLHTHIQFTVTPNNAWTTVSWSNHNGHQRQLYYRWWLHI